MRSDTDRNRRRLIAAAAYLVARRGTDVKMTDVANRADVSAATAYRHFGSLDEILAEFRYAVGLQLREYSARETLGGVELLEAVSLCWVTLVVKHGRAMVYTRSRVGYLERLRDGARYLTVQADALRRPITEAAGELGVPDPGDQGMFLWNVLFDPREIFDLITTVGMTKERVGQQLVAAFCGAISRWSEPEHVVHRV